MGTTPRLDAFAPLLGKISHEQISAGQPEKARPKRKGGRPTRYRKDFAELAEFFGVAERTLNEWEKNHREFRQSLKEGKSRAVAGVANVVKSRRPPQSNLKGPERFLGKDSP